MLIVSNSKLAIEGPNGDFITISSIWPILLDERYGLHYMKGQDINHQWIHSYAGFSVRASVKLTRVLTSSKRSLPKVKWISPEVYN